MLIGVLSHLQLHTTRVVSGCQPPSDVLPASVLSLISHARFILLLLHKRGSHRHDTPSPTSRRNLHPMGWAAIVDEMAVWICGPCGSSQEGGGRKWKMHMLMPQLLGSNCCSHFFQNLPVNHLFTLPRMLDWVMIVGGKALKRTSQVLFK